MQLSRRQFLRLVATIAAAVGLPVGFTRRIGGGPFKPQQSQRIPALVADASTTGHLIHLDQLPEGPDGVALASAALPPARPAAVPSQRRWVMVIDLARCDGCRACTEACAAMHFVPPGQEWIKVYKMRDNPAAEPYWFPRPCMQCDNPPCVKVCPVSATWKREDGIVIQDGSRCIGCRFCLAACPYSARYFNWTEPPHTPEELSRPYSIERAYPHVKGVTEKCIFCPGLIKDGKLPACVEACPMGAIYFGDQNEDAVTNSQGETVRLSELVGKNAGYRYLEELGTESRVYYLPPRNRVYPPPLEPTTPEGGHR